MQKVKIYMAGSGGMLGEVFYEKFRDSFDVNCTDIDVNDDWIEYLDFRDSEAYREDMKNFNRSRKSF